MTDVLGLGYQVVVEDWWTKAATRLLVDMVELLRSWISSKERRKQATLPFAIREDLASQSYHKQ